jgi:hypothetical protein
MGLFLLSSSLAEAETTVMKLLCRTLANCPELSDYTLIDVAVPLIPVDLDTGRLMPRTDQDITDPFRFL